MTDTAIRHGAENTLQNGTSYGGTQPNSKVQTSASTSVHIETRHDLSLLFKIVRTCLRPLRPKLVQINQVHPAGSPRLQKHPASHYGVKFVERCVSVPNNPEYPLPQVDSATNTQNLWLYDCEPPHLGGKREIVQRVYYFAGGGFQAPPSGEHWKMCAKMAKQLAPHDIAVTIVSYPLVPNSPAWASLPLLRAWLVHTITELQNSRSNETITLMGDSAGGNVAVVLGFWIAKLAATRRAGLQTHDTEMVDMDPLKRLNHVVAISGPVDLTNTNPGIDEADKHDPILTRALTDKVADQWTKDYPLGEFAGPVKAHPELSPNRQTAEAWAALRDSGIRLDGLFGTADVLAPDCRVFMEHCEKQGIAGNWLIWEGQMHCFPMIQCYGLREGKAGLQWLCEQVVS